VAGDPTLFSRVDLAIHFIWNISVFDTYTLYNKDQKSQPNQSQNFQSQQWSFSTPDLRKCVYRVKINIAAITVFGYFGTSSKTYCGNEKDRGKKTSSCQRLGVWVQNAGRFLCIFRPK